MNFDITIIGGGITGTAIARELSRFRLRVALLEKEEELSFGVSKSNSGIIHPGTQISPASLKGRLCVQGNRLTRETAGELGLDFKQCGELIVAFDDADIARLHAIQADAEALGVPGLEIVDRQWLSRREPNVSDTVIAALYAPTAGIISPYRMVYALSEDAALNGVRVCTGTEVTGISVRGPHRFEITADSGTFRSGFVINCAGLFADEVCRMAGVTDVRIMPRKGEEFLLDKKREHLTNHLIFPLPTATSKGTIVIKTSDGNPMIGPTADDTNDKFDLTTSDQGLKKVFAAASRMVPSVRESDIIAYFSGLRPVAGDDFIIRHEDKVPGFVTVAGIQSPGLTAAPAIALYVRDILAQQGLRLKKKIMPRRARKKDVHLFAIPLEETRRQIRRDRRYGDIVCRCEMVSAAEIERAIDQGACTMDGIKFRTRAQAGRCHGSFCTTRIMKILSRKRRIAMTSLTKRGRGTEIVKKDRADA